MRAILSLTILASLTATVFAADPAGDAASRVAVALALAQKKPAQSPPPELPTPIYELLVISRENCPPCAKLKAELQANGQGDDFPDWHIRRDDALSKKYNVTLFPTILLLKDGKEVGRIIGYTDAPTLKTWVEEHKSQSRSNGNESNVAYGVYSGGPSVAVGRSIDAGSFPVQSRPQAMYRPQYFGQASCST